MQTALLKPSATISHKRISIDDVSIFYREAGDPNHTTILMLHGFPSSSHMYRNVIADLQEEYHIIAPDYPGFGFSDTPDTETFEYTFDNISAVIDQFIDALGLNEFYLMMQDYGGPIGLRIATARPHLIKGLIIQNANLYLEGLGEWAQKIGGHVANNEMEALTAFKNHLMSDEGIEMQYTAGAKNPSAIDPIAYLTDIAFFNRENVRHIQSALFVNYGSNFPKYPEWQNYLSTYQPSILILWGTNDKFFSAEGGKAYGKHLDNVETHLFDGGHFMLEEYADEANIIIRNFLQKH